jgi:hypothetical protein
MKILCDFSDNAAFAAGWSECGRHPTQHLALVFGHRNSRPPGIAKGGANYRREKRMSTDDNR